MVAVMVAIGQQIVKQEDARSVASDAHAGKASAAAAAELDSARSDAGGLMDLLQGL